MYIALIGAVIQSNQRGSHNISRELTDVLDQINQNYQASLTVDLTMTNQDEFQGVFKATEHLFEIIDIIKFSLYPMEFRFGVGLGEIQTAMDGRKIGEMDGPAFWHARSAVNRVLEENASQLSRILLSAGGDGSEFQLLNDSLKLCDFVENRWRDSQRELVKISLLANGHSDHVLQSNLAKELGISRQAANQRVQSSGFYQFIRMKQSVSDTFSGVYRSLQ